MRPRKCYLNTASADHAIAGHLTALKYEYNHCSMLDKQHTVLYLHLALVVGIRRQCLMQCLRGSCGGTWQASSWKAAMQQSRQALEALAGTYGAAADGEEMAGWGSSDGSSVDGTLQPALQPADPQKPMLELHASLGEFAIIASGRVADNWWPADEVTHILFGLGHTRWR